MNSSLSAFLPISHRALVWQLVKREVQAKYRGSVLGLTWTFLTPLLMLAVYTFVFREIFKARWGSGEGGGVEFAIYAFAGLVALSWFSEVIGRAPRLVLEQPNLVKRVVFPLPLLAWVAVGSGTLTLLINAFVLLVASVAAGYAHLTAVWLPLVWLPLLPLMLGLTWFLSALGVYLRDVGQVIGLMLTLLMFLSPVFYPASALPAKMQPWLFLNPLTLIMEQTRAVLLLGQMPDFSALLISFLAGTVVAVLGAIWFQTTRKGFADVL